MKYSNYEYEQIKDAIAIGDLRHYTATETIAFVEQRSGIKIYRDTFYKIRGRLKKETEKRFIELVRSKYDYQHEIMKSLQEKEDLISKTWDEFTVAEESKERIYCLKVIDQIQNSKYQIIKDMPNIVLGSGNTFNYDNANPTAETEQQQQQSATETNNKVF